MEGVTAMPTLRLAYATQYLIAVIAVFVLWSQVGGQSHLDLMPWYVKLGLGAGEMCIRDSRCRDRTGGQTR